LLQTKAREQALNQANEKAQKIAAQLNVVLGKVLHVEEISSPEWEEAIPATHYRLRLSARFRQDLSMLEQQSTEDFLAQTIRVNAMIRMIFELKQSDESHP
jgi:uncharacterized protein YggE